jgi:hypothetical protein
MITLKPPEKTLDQLFALAATRSKFARPAKAEIARRLHEKLRELVRQ